MSAPLLHYIERELYALPDRLDHKSPLTYCYMAAGVLRLPGKDQGYRVVAIQLDLLYPPLLYDIIVSSL